MVRQEIGSTPTEPQSYGSQSCGSESYGSESYGLESYRSESRESPRQSLFRERVDKVVQVASSQVALRGSCSSGVPGVDSVSVDGRVGRVGVCCVRTGRVKVGCVRVGCVSGVGVKVTSESSRSRRLGALVASCCEPVGSASRSVGFASVSVELVSRRSVLRQSVPCQVVSRQVVPRQVASVSVTRFPNPKSMLPSVLLQIKRAAARVKVQRMARRLADVGKIQRQDVA